jgi:hypothetical protein
MSQDNKLLFPLGQTLATPGAIVFLASHSLTPSSFISLHVRGDWGDLEEEDKTRNQEALTEGSRIFSAYNVGDGKVWIITEADRSSTTVLLPEEY